MPQKFVNRDLFASVEYPSNKFYSVARFFLFTIIRKSLASIVMFLHCSTRVSIFHSAKTRHYTRFQTINFDSSRFIPAPSHVHTLRWTLRLQSGAFTSFNILHFVCMQVVRKLCSRSSCRRWNFSFCRVIKSRSVLYVIV